MEAIGWAYMGKKVLPDLTHSPAFNLNWLKAELENCIWCDDEPPGTVDNLEIINTWDTDKALTVVYQATLSGKGSDPQTQLYTGNLYDNEKLQDAYERLQGQVAAEPPVGRAITLVPEANMVLTAFPNDAGMRLMSEEILLESLKAYLPEITRGELKNKRWKITQIKTEILRYVPNKRFTMRCIVTVKTGRKTEKTFRFVAKQLKSARKANELYNNLYMIPKIWKDNISDLEINTMTSESFELPVRIPYPLAYDEANRIVYFEELPGKNLLKALHEIDVRTIIPAIGELLANFHCACKPTRKIVSFEGELAEMDEAIQKVIRKMPRLKSRLNRIYREMGTNLPEKDFFLSLLHGTFRLNHIFVHNNELALLDMDSVRMGHPAYDVANFLSSLYYLEAQNRLSSLQRYDISLQFLTSYANHSNWPIAPKVVLWFLTSLLIHKQVYKYLKHLHEDRELKINRILTLTEEVLDLYHNISPDTRLVDLWQVLPGNSSDSVPGTRVPDVI